MKINNLTGQKFGRLTIIRRVKNDKHGKAQWLCQCNCGKQTIVHAAHLKSGNTKSCGCLAIEIRTKHGHAKQDHWSKTYETWHSMIQRCTNLNGKRYKDYGGRGIQVCEAWMKFADFLQDMGERPLNMSIDRIDNNGDYCKENCRWATQKEQQRNTCSNKLFTIDGVIKCLAEWCEYYGLKYSTVYARIYYYGWTIEEALELKHRKK